MEVIAIMKARLEGGISLARKRVINEQELMIATEELLLERGYEGFHFKALSEKLGTARSTIYEYYPNKDELIATYTKMTMDVIINKVLGVKKIPKVKEQLRKLLEIFITFSHIHRLLQIVERLKAMESDRIQRQIEELNNDYKKLFSLMIDIVEKAQSENWIRHDLTPQIIAMVFFTSIPNPKELEMDPERWSETLFTIFFDGIKME